MRGRDPSAIDASGIETFFFNERAMRDELVLQAAESLNDEQLAAYAERRSAALGGCGGSSCRLRRFLIRLLEICAGGSGWLVGNDVWLFLCN